jgi:hypothetical protein
LAGQPHQIIVIPNSTGSNVVPNKSGGAPRTSTAFQHQQQIRATAGAMAGPGNPQQQQLRHIQPGKIILTLYYS